jgi:hypothetical protein
MYKNRFSQRNTHFTKPHPEKIQDESNAICSFRFSYFYPFRFDFQDVLSPGEVRDGLLLLEAMKEQPDCMDRVYGEREMNHTPFGQILLGDRRGRESQTLEYFLVVLLRVYANKEEILRIHADHIRALQVSEVALHCEILFQVIF